MSESRSHPEAFSLLAFLDRCPPFVVYYGAHFGKPDRPNVDELAQAAGMPRRTFIRTSRKTSWISVKVGIMSAFCNACGINLADPVSTDNFLSKLAAEVGSSEPFKELSGHRRKAMLREFNRLAADRAAERSMAALAMD